MLVIRFRNAKVCFRRARGIPWSNSGLNILTLPFFKKKLKCVALLLLALLTLHCHFMQAAKKLYESLLSDSVNTTALAHIQVRNCWFLSADIS